VTGRDSPKYLCTITKQMNMNIEACTEAGANCLPRPLPHMSTKSSCRHNLSRTYIRHLYSHAAQHLRILAINLNVFLHNHNVLFLFQPHTRLAPQLHKEHTLIEQPQRVRRNRCNNLERESRDIDFTIAEGDVCFRNTNIDASTIPGACLSNDRLF
jgi:hypothetical protein